MEGHPEGLGLTLVFLIDFLGKFLDREEICVLFACVSILTACVV
jgi:hypothetical protein